MYHPRLSNAIWRTLFLFSTVWRRKRVNFWTIFWNRAAAQSFGEFPQENADLSLLPLDHCSHVSPDDSFMGDSIKKGDSLDPMIITKFLFFLFRVVLLVFSSMNCCDLLRRCRRDWGILISSVLSDNILRYSWVITEGELTAAGLYTPGCPAFHYPTLLRAVATPSPDRWPILGKGILPGAPSDVLSDGHYRTYQRLEWIPLHSTCRIFLFGNFGILWSRRLGFKVIFFKIMLTTP